MTKYPCAFCNLRFENSNLAFRHEYIVHNHTNPGFSVYESFGRDGTQEPELSSNVPSGQESGQESGEASGDASGQISGEASGQASMPTTPPPQLNRSSTPDTSSNGSDVIPDAPLNDSDESSDRREMEIRVRKFFSKMVKEADMEADNELEKTAETEGDGGNMTERFRREGSASNPESPRPVRKLARTRSKSQVMDTGAYEDFSVWNEEQLAPPSPVTAPAQPIPIPPSRIPERRPVGSTALTLEVKGFKASVFMLPDGTEVSALDTPESSGSDSRAVTSGLDSPLVPSEFSYRPGHQRDLSGGSVAKKILDRKLERLSAEQDANEDEDEDGDGDEMDEEEKVGDEKNGDEKDGDVKDGD
ncbi:hypothetical protein SBOR_1564 [Sclerotinia borealis F-4128]|uniref:C2H2-type domain-containing protein n=1 Tax=Sclerotinia borealis (strain F-4128) TaxID=1432307 RepID=W9CPQ0_SCLBF|nr:hypothetical protein SBOR_1564 [Sclerotinia borealis F-4128]